jgi:hypothetical protein
MTKLWKTLKETLERSRELTHPLPRTVPTLRVSHSPPLSASMRELHCQEANTLLILCNRSLKERKTGCKFQTDKDLNGKFALFTVPFPGLGQNLPIMGRICRNHSSSKKNRC